MKNSRYRLLIFAGSALVAVWVVAALIFHFSAKTKVTLENVHQFVDTTDLNRLSASARQKAIADYADMVNSLSLEERMKWRREDGWKNWFAEMTEEERAAFIEKTLPNGLKQLMVAFSELPAEQRKKVIDNAIDKLKESGPPGIDKSMGDYGSNGPPPLSPKLEQQVREIGLNKFYTDSSPETKAELAPLLEQMEIQIRNGPAH